MWVLRNVQTKRIHKQGKRGECLYFLASLVCGGIVRTEDYEVVRVGKEWRVV